MKEDLRDRLVAWGVEVSRNEVFTGSYWLGLLGFSVRQDSGKIPRINLSYTEVGATVGEKPTDCHHMTLADRIVHLVAI